MAKPIFGVVAGAVVYFVWGMLSWTVIPWHNHVVRTLPEEQLISDTLKTVVPDSGFYVFPSMTQNGETMDRAAFGERYMKGPTGVLIFSVGGKKWMGLGNYFTAMLAALAVAAVGMMLLCSMRDRVTTIFCRALMMMSVGVVVFLATNLSYWNWFGFPSDFIRVAAADSLVTFFLLGLAQSPFVPAPKP